MKITPELVQEIMNLQTVGEAVRMLRAYAQEEPELQKVIQQATYGIQHNFHYKRYEDQMYVTKEKSGYVIMNHKEIPLEELWDEIDQRIGIAIHALTTHLQDQQPFEAR